MRKFKLILCDLGNVLLLFDHQIAVRKILKFTDKNPKEIYQLFFDSPLTKDFEEGKISPLEFFTRISRQLQLKNLTFENFASIWNEIFSGNKGLLELLYIFKKKYHLHLISNINELHYDYILKKFAQYLEVFDKVYLSHLVGHRKPDVEIYRSAIEDCGFRPQETLYVDDRADLIREAAKLGIKTVLFKNINDFKRELERLKVLP